MSKNLTSDHIVALRSARIRTTPYCTEWNAVFLGPKVKFGIRRVSVYTFSSGTWAGNLDPSDPVEIVCSKMGKRIMRFRLGLSK